MPANAATTALLHHRSGHDRKADFAWHEPARVLRAVGIGWNDLAAFETGAKRINANLLFRVAKSLDVRPGYFFRGFVEEQPKAI
jgi:transcriptional regulator with XRE-family HTH domain